MPYLRPKKAILREFILQIVILLKDTRLKKKIRQVSVKDDTSYGDKMLQLYLTENKFVH